MEHGYWEGEAGMSMSHIIWLLIGAALGYWLLPKVMPRSG
jgi:hypothetical protein